MIQSTFTTRVLTPENGYLLTQVEEVDIKDRIFSDKLFLGINDSPSNWKEISEEEANFIMAQQEELRKLEESNTEDENDN